MKRVHKTIPSLLFWEIDWDRRAMNPMTIELMPIGSCTYHKNSVKRQHKNKLIDRIDTRNSDLSDKISYPLSCLIRPIKWSLEVVDYSLVSLQVHPSYKKKHNCALENFHEMYLPHKGNVSVEYMKNEHLGVPYSRFDRKEWLCSWRFEAELSRESEGISISRNFLSWEWENGALISWTGAEKGRAWALDRAWLEMEMEITWK